MEYEYINLTPHAIKLNDGRVFPVSGTVARVECEYTDARDDLAMQTMYICESLPPPKQGVRYIVSAIVREAVEHLRDDVVSPATNHPESIRNKDGKIISVECFCRNWTRI